MSYDSDNVQLADVASDVRGNRTGGGKCRLGKEKQMKFERNKRHTNRVLTIAYKRSETTVFQGT